MHVTASIQVTQLTSPICLTTGKAFGDLADLFPYKAFPLNPPYTIPTCPCFSRAQRVQRTAPVSDVLGGGR